MRTFLGRNPGFFASDGRRPYTQRWSYSVQFQPGARNVFEIGYIGSRSTRLRVDTEFNPIPRQYLSTLPVRDQPAVDLLSSRVTNPFRGIDGFQGTAFSGGANTTLSQILRPYPHFTGLSTALPAGSSWYHAATFRFEQRFRKGLQAQAIYTWSKTMEAVSYLNETDSIPEHVVSNLDRPHRLTLSAMYELPFGAGRALMTGAGRLLDSIVGGWQLQAIFQGQSGPPLAFGNVIYTGEYAKLKPSSGERSIDRWFHTGGFETNSGLQLLSNIRTFPARIASVRADGINVWDLSLHKNLRLIEGLTLQLRLEVEGAMNHPNFAAPNIDPTSTLFGQVRGTQGGQEERRTFVALKLIF